MKRSTCTVAATVTMTTILALSACGGGGNADSDTSPDASRPATITDEQVEAAQDDGKVIVYSNAPDAMWDGLLPQFEELFPGITVETVDIGGPELVQRYLSEKRADVETADLIFDSAASTWLELGESGDIIDRQSTSEEGLPDLSLVGEGIYAVAADPSIIIYNKELMGETEPDSLQDLVDVVDENHGKYTTYDISNGLGYSLFWTYDQNADEDARSKIDALLPATTVEGSGGSMIQKIGQGEYVAGYMQSGAARVLMDDLGGTDLLEWQYQSDGTVATPRFSGVTEGGKHPDAAALLQDYLLTANGQSSICQSGLTAVRDDDDVVDACGDYSLASVRDAIGDENLFIAPLNEQLANDEDSFAESFNEQRTR